MPHDTDHSGLAPLGWDSGWSEAFAEAGARAGVPGRVGRVDRGRVEVALGIDEAGAIDSVLAVSQLGSRAGAEDQPATGDWVVVDPRPDGAVITAVLPRRTSIVRGSAGGTSQGQVLATNIDTVLIAVPLELEINLNQVERFVTIAWESGAQPLVVLTKSDLVDDPAAAVEQAIEAAPGAEVLAVSVVTGDGLDQLRSVLGVTTALLGTSGAGKSTLVNAINGSEQMATQETRRDGKGRHTTTTRELILQPTGVLIDTPGLRGIGIHDSSSGVAQTFSDVEELAEQCRFTDCSHESEPGCAVRAAVEDGTLTERRLDSYWKQRREATWAATRNDPAALSARRKTWAKATKDGRAAGQLKRGEV